MPMYTILADTARPSTNTATKPASVSAPRPYKQAIPIHLEPYPVLDYAVKPTNNMSTLYQGTCDSGTDIQTGDLITKMVLTVDGVTPYPSDAAPQNTPNQSWVVSLAQESQPGPAAHRVLYVQRMVGGGPTRTARG